jgi:AcrR family transcriptional regulator
MGEAVLRLIATRGLEAASLRNVAAEAGVSMGTVQHYFTSKQEMLDFAQRYNYERATVRIPQLIAALPEPHSIRTQLRALPYHHRPAFSEHAVRALANQTAKAEICGRAQIRHGKFVLPGY